MRKLLALVLSSLLVATPAFADRTMYAPVRLAPTATAGTILFGDGTAAAPAISFSADPDTGMYKITGNVLSFSAGGVGQAHIQSNTLWFGRAILTSGANPANFDVLPGYSTSTNIAGTNLKIGGGPGTGSAAGGALIFQTSPAGSSGTAVNSGVERMRITSDGQILTGDGTAAAPVLSFSADTDTGIYRPANDQFGVSLGGTLRLFMTGPGLHLGNGFSSATPTSAVIRSTDGTGTNIAGADLSIAGGQSTGTGAGGALRFFTSAAGSSGTTTNTNTERMRITSTGDLQFNQTEQNITTNTSDGTDNKQIRLGGGGAIGTSRGGYIIAAGNEHGNSGSVQLVGGAVAGGNVDLYATNASAAVRLFSDSTERVRVKGNGQVRFIPLAADPAGAEDGDVYYNSATNKLRVRAGGAWVDLH